MRLASCLESVGVNEASLVTARTSARTCWLPFCERREPPRSPAPAIGACLDFLHQTHAHDVHDRGHGRRVGAAAERQEEAAHSAAAEVVPQPAGRAVGDLLLWQVVARLHQTRPVSDTVGDVCRRNLYWPDVTWMGAVEATRPTQVRSKATLTRGTASDLLACTPRLMIEPRYDRTSSRSSVAVTTSTSSKPNWEPADCQRST